MSAIYQPLCQIKAESDITPLSWELTIERQERKSESFRCTTMAALMEGERGISCVLKVVLEFSSCRAKGENGRNGMWNTMKT